MLGRFDPELADLTRREAARQRATINLIASENFASPLTAGMEGSIWANRNVEGCPGKRFVAGCERADRVEALAIERAKQLFGAEPANVQAMSATIDYAGFSEIAQSVGALLFVDLAHNVGLVAGGVIPSPVPYADVVSTSTHKTFRGPRGGGLVLCRKEPAAKIDRAVFPGLQGAPKLDMIAARAVLFRECMTDAYRRYAAQVVANARALAEGCHASGLRLVSGGTDTHLALVDVTGLIPTGREAEAALAAVDIIGNRNGIPFDTQPPNIASGLRIGSPALTTRGMKEAAFLRVGTLLGQVLKQRDDAAALAAIRTERADLAGRYPLFAAEWMPEA